MIPSNNVAYELWDFDKRQLIAYEEYKTLEGARIGIILSMQKLVNYLDDTRFLNHVLIKTVRLEDGTYDSVRVAAENEISEWVMRVTSEYAKMKGV